MAFQAVPVLVDLIDDTLTNTAPTKTNNLISSTILNRQAMPAHTYGKGKVSQGSHASVLP